MRAVRCRLTHFNSLFILLISFILSSCSLSGKISSTAPTNSSTTTASGSDKIVPEYGVASITVSLSKSYTQNISFNYYTQDSTAAAGVDYISVSGSTTILAGQTSVIVSVPILDNQIKNSNKKFMLHFSNISSSDVSLASLLIEIQDDDYDPLTNVQSVSLGPNNACIITTSGAAKCWGGNGNGKLGDGTTTKRDLPVNVNGLTSGVVEIAGGDNHTCARTTLGGAKCWGLNTSGQLGDNTTTDNLAAVDVDGLTSGVASIKTGYNHSCALTAAAGIKCWGDNVSGQLGNNSTTPSSIPVDVNTLTSGVASISIGANHSCALTTGGGAKCWGSNATGQIGDNSTTQRNSPTDVSGLTSGVSAVSAGYLHSCAITTAGAVRCWGRNTDGQLGDSSNTQRLTSVPVTGLASGITAIATGYNHTCALTSTGSVKCWGGNAFGQLGDGTNTSRNSPVDVSGLTSGVSAIAVGTSFSCAVMSSGNIKCWGNAGSGQMGNGFAHYRPIPMDVAGLTSGVAVISTGEMHACAVTTSGGAKCWGDNLYGYLGDSSTTARTTPVNVTGLTSGVASISANRAHTCALTTGGGVKCWGVGGNGQLGDNTATQRSSPVDVSTLTSGVASVAVGSSHSCALTTGGGVKCWGSNLAAQIGDGTSTQRNAPVDVSGLTSGVASISVGENHTCVVTTGGGAKCWGNNPYGQLGDNSVTQRNAPVDVFGLTSGVAAIAAGANHTCALMTSGSVKCWGYNAVGQLGDGTTTQSLVPVDSVLVPSGVTSILAGNDFTCLRTSAGEAKCWGNNNNGQLGDGTSTSRGTLADVSALSSGVTSLAVPRTAQSRFACAILSSGGLKCWGVSTNGQLGTAYTNLVPQLVLSP